MDANTLRSIPDPMDAAMYASSAFREKLVESGADERFSEYASCLLCLLMFAFEARCKGIIGLKYSAEINALTERAMSSIGVKKEEIDSALSFLMPHGFDEKKVEEFDPQEKDARLRVACIRAIVLCGTCAKYAGLYASIDGVDLIDTVTAGIAAHSKLVGVDESSIDSLYLYCEDLLAKAWQRNNS